MKYNMIDRSNIDFTSDAEICNIGYFEGLFQDIPVRIEDFVHNNVRCITIFIPIECGLNDEKSIKSFLEKNRIIEIVEDNIYITELGDANDSEFYSINVPLESNNHVFNRSLIEMKNYE